jgi:hypothetical protein
MPARHSPCPIPCSLPAELSLRSQLGNWQGEAGRCRGSRIEIDLERFIEAVGDLGDAHG